MKQRPPLAILPLGDIGIPFDRRKLAIPTTLPSGLSDAFVQDAAKQRQWAAFLKKNRLEALDLAQVVARLRGVFQKLTPEDASVSEQNP